MRTAITATVCILLLSIAGGWAEEAGSAFRPMAVPGTSYEGTLEISGDLNIAATYWGASNNSNYTYALSDTFRHTTISAQENGVCRTAVRRFDNCAFNATRAGKPQEAPVALKGRKVYVENAGAPVSRPSPQITPLDFAIAVVDIDDPFRELLPEAQVKKDMFWQANTEAVNRILFRMRSVQNAIPKPKEDDKDKDKDKDKPKPPPDDRWGGWGRNFQPPPVVVMIRTDKAEAKITDFRLESFSFEIIVSGEFDLPVSFKDKVAIPFSGKITATYSNQHGAIKQGEITLGTDFDKSVDISGNKVSVKLRWNDHMMISRNHIQALPYATSFKLPARFFDPSGKDGAIIAAGVAPEGLVLGANWEGTNVFEILNKGAAIRELKDLPICGASSSDGGIVLLCYKDFIWLSGNGGDTFTSYPWKTPAITSIAFGWGEVPAAFALCEDGCFYRIDVSGNKFNAKKLTTTIGAKKPIWSWVAGEPDLALFANEDACYTAPLKGSSNFSKIKDSPALHPTVWTRVDGGVVVLSGSLYNVGSGGISKYGIEGIPDGVKQIAVGAKDMFFLTANNELYSVPLSGGMPAPVEKGVDTIACRYGKQFLAKPEGLVIK